MENQLSDILEVSGTPARSAHEALATDSYGAYHITLYEDIRHIAGEWDKLGHENILLSSAYLSALQAAPPDDMRFHYLMVHAGDILKGIAFTQLDRFRATRSIRYQGTGSAAGNARGLLQKFRIRIADKVQFNTLVCGNTLVTGKHGFLFTPDMQDVEQISIVSHVMQWLHRDLKKQGINVGLLFIKDFFRPLFDDTRTFGLVRRYHRFHAQPNMILHLDPSWETIDDYLHSLSSKYRIRVRRAKKKCADIVHREMDLEEIRQHKDRMMTLYRSIAERVSFNLFILNTEYFCSVKEHLGERFKVWGYYDSDDRLIAFYTVLINGEEVEAHFLGYQDTVNRDHQLYLNMLVKILKFSISISARRIVYGRTAPEIKSSVGAEPYHMFFYLQYKHWLINGLVPWIYGLLEPPVQWSQRHPFR